MLTILTTTETLGSVKEIISSIHRLSELVEVVTKDHLFQGNNKVLVIIDNRISCSIDWNDTEPPYIFPEIQYSKENLLGIVFYKLGNHQKAFDFIARENSLFSHLLIATNLQFGYAISGELANAVKLESLHNNCVIKHYGNIEPLPKEGEVKALYTEAIARASNDEFRLFTIKHFVNFLLDSKSFLEAEKVLRIALPKAISDESKIAISSLLSTTLISQLSLPYNSEGLLEIRELQDDCIEFFETKQMKVNAGLILVDASEVANYQNSFIESKNFINKAIQYFKEENIPEFLGEAGFRKATLLYTWSKNGSPQYYKPAINAFQDTLKVIKRDVNPQKFADIHHNLALIYSEIPVSSDEKPIWTAFCASSFKEVLSFYTKDKYPYEYAMASHNYATALMNFPEAKLHNNLDKAFGLFEDALTVRTVEEYPFERALTLLNQLELYWHMNNENEEEELEKFDQMKEKAVSILSLIKDENLIVQARQHLKQLEKLKTILV